MAHYHQETKHSPSNISKQRAQQRPKQAPKQIPKQPSTPKLNEQEKLDYAIAEAYAKKQQEWVGVILKRDINKS